MKTTYMNWSPNTGYVDRAGKQHIFRGNGVNGFVVTDSPSLIEELDAAIASGAPFVKQDAEAIVKNPAPTTAELSAQALAAAKAGTVIGAANTVNTVAK